MVVPGECADDYFAGARLPEGADGADDDGDEGEEY